MRKARGFTLIEILAALTMFALVGGMLLQLFETGLRSARTSAEISHGALLARSKMTEMLAYPTLTPGTISGEFDETYRWRVDLTLPETERTFATLHPLNLVVTVYWGAEGDESSFQLKTLCFTTGLEP
jgi:general secretion pathway protein I